MYKDTTTISLLDEIITVHTRVINLEGSVICSQQYTSCVLSVEWNSLSAAGLEYLLSADVMLHSERSPLTVTHSLTILFCTTSLCSEITDFKIEDVFLLRTNTSQGLFLLDIDFCLFFFFVLPWKKHFEIKKLLSPLQGDKLGFGPGLKSRIMFHSLAFLPKFT